MVMLVIGGSASGKSELAENMAVRVRGKKRCYLATMEPLDSESIVRIQRHREMRKEKGFETFEKSSDLMGAAPYLVEYDVILLECLTNLVANEVFQKGLSVPETIKSIKAGITEISKVTPWLILVSGDVFGDGQEYDPGTRKYQQILGELHQHIGNVGDAVIEVVGGRTVVHKGKELLINEGIL